jgi:hypothetical protein
LDQLVFLDQLVLQDKVLELLVLWKPPQICQHLILATQVMVILFNKQAIYMFGTEYNGLMWGTFKDHRVHKAIKDQLDQQVLLPDQLDHWDLLV